MGTLFNQPERNRHNVSYWDIKSRAEQIRDIAKELNMPDNAVTTVYLATVLNRFTSAYIDNGDIHDEQMHGIGELIQRLASAIENEPEDDVL
jgi:hypothetical protein